MGNYIFCSHSRGRCSTARIAMHVVFASIGALQLAGGALVNAQSGSNSAALIGALTGSTAMSANAVTARSGAASSSGLVAIPEDFSKLKIQAGFLLDIQVLDESDLCVALRVNDAGDVPMPLAGPIHVAGDTLSQAEQQITEKLVAAEILKRPQVRVNVLQYASTTIAVLGEVNSAGRLQMLVPHSLLDVITFAGGETPLAGDKIEVRHEEDGKAVVTTYHYGRNSNGDSIADIMVHNGDTVIVPRTGIVYVLGAVYRPGGYPMQEDGKIDAAQALSLAMGTNMAAKTTNISIIRRHPDGTYVEFKLNYQDMVKGKIIPPVLEAQDIVYVPVDRPRAVLQSALGIIATTSSATIYTLR